MATSFYPHFLSQEEFTKAFEKHAPVPCDFKAAIMRRNQDNTSVFEILASLSSFRIYTEWCMDSVNGGGGDWDAHARYNGEAFAKFLEDERQFYAQDKRYVEMLEVVDAFARSCLDFFIRRCDWRTMMPEKGINIRRNLAPWLDNPQLYVLDQR